MNSCPHLCIIYSVNKTVQSAYIVYLGLGVTASQFSCRYTLKAHPKTETERHDEWKQERDSEMVNLYEIRVLG